MQKGFLGALNPRLKPGVNLSNPIIKKWLFISILALWLLALAFPALAQAQAAIQVISSSAQADYPQSLTFKIQVQSSANITKIALRYRLDRLACVSNIISEAWPEFSPAPKVATSWVWQMKKTGGIPPGAKLEYNWLIVDDKGQRLETPPAALIFEDSRYPWRNITEGIVTLYWYEGDNSFAQSLVAAAQEAFRRMAQDTGTKLERPVKIYIYNSSDALQSARVFAPTWEGGVAFPEYSIVAIGVAPSNLSWGKTTVAHELAHVLTHQMTRNCYGNIPTWLSEGLATYAEGELETNQQRRLQRAINENKLFSVRTLSAPFPAQPELALLSYAESYSLVKFLIATYGSEKMVAFLDAFKNGLGPDEALTKAYSLDTDKLDTQWRNSLKAPTLPPPTPSPSPSILPSPVPTPVPSPVPTPAPSPAITAAPSPTPPLPTPLAVATPAVTPPATPPPSRGFLSCRAAPAPTGAPIPEPKWGSGLIAFGVVALGLSVFGWIRRGRR